MQDIYFRSNAALLYYYSKQSREDKLRAKEVLRISLNDLQNYKISPNNKFIPNFKLEELKEAEILRLTLLRLKLMKKEYPNLTELDDLIKELKDNMFHLKFQEYGGRKK